MAKIIKRYWWLALLQVVLIAFAASFLIYRTLHQPEVAQARPDAPPPSTQPLDRLTYSRVRQLREQLALTNADLASVGCNQASAQDVLNALLTWYQQNASDWTEKESTLRSSMNALGETQRLIRVGPANEALVTRLASQKQTLETANTAWTQFIEGAATSARSKLSAEQIAVWTIARANLRSPSRYRYVSGVAEANAQRLLAIIHKRGQTSNEVNQLEQSLLNANQRTAMTTAWSNEQSHAVEVQTAEGGVLVPPPASDAP
jgi:hypothetical protein